MIVGLISYVRIVSFLLIDFLDRDRLVLLLTQALLLSLHGQVNRRIERLRPCINRSNW